MTHSFTILTDSSSNLPDEIINDNELEILPLTLMCDGIEVVSYDRERKSDLSVFYRIMRQGRVFTTSLPNMQESIDTIHRILESGSDLLYVGFSSALSGTYEATVNILNDISSEYPDRKIFTCDTRGASLGEGMLVMYAIDMRREGKSIEEVHAWLQEHRFHLAHWFTVDDLMYLYRGGRVSRSSAAAGTFLSIKPILHMDDSGHLIPMEKVRSRKRSIEALYKHMKETFDPSYGPQHIGISHGDCIDDAIALQKMIESDGSFEIADFTINYVDPVIGAHSGPGTLALFYLGTNRD